MDKSKWKIYKLGEVATYVNGFAFKPSDWTDNGLPIIRIQNLTNSEAEYNYYNKEIPAKYKVVKGDILVSWSATLGVFEWDKEDAYLNQHIFKVVFDKGCKITKEYFKYAISQAIDEMRTKVHGLTMQHIVKSDFDNTEIPVPPIEEQRRIVEELDLLGGVVAAKERQLKELDALAQSTFYTMFDDPITNEKGWDIKTLENVCCGKATYGAGASAEPYTEGKSRYIRITDIDENGRLNENKVTATVDDESKYLLHNGDLLFARSGATVGKTYLYQEKDGKAIYAGYLIRFVPNKKMVDPLYLFHYTRSDFYKHWVQSMQNAVAQPNINAKQYGVLSVLVPPLDLQQAFAEKIEAIEQQKQLIRQSLVQTQNLLAATLQKYFGQTED